MLFRDAGVPGFPLLAQPFHSGGEDPEINREGGPEIQASMDFTVERPGVEFAGRLNDAVNGLGVRIDSGTDSCAFRRHWRLARRLGHDDLCRLRRRRTLAAQQRHAPNEGDIFLGVQSVLVTRTLWGRHAVAPFPRSQRGCRDPGGLGYSLDSEFRRIRHGAPFTYVETVLGPSKPKPLR